MKTTKLGIVCLLFLLFACMGSLVRTAQAQTYYIQSQSLVPFPFDPYDGAEPVLTLDASRHIYQVQDNTNDWNLLTEAQTLDSMVAGRTMGGTGFMSLDSIDPGGGAGFSGLFQPLVFGSNDLWIEVTNVDIVDQQASLILHGTIPDEHYQLLSTNVLTSDGLSWTLGEYITGAADTNETPFSTVNIGTNSQMFFRAHHANQVLAVSAYQNAIEPNPATGDPGQSGFFQIRGYYNFDTNLTVHYKIGGTAQAGIDYSNLSGSVTLSSDNPSTNIEVIPFADSNIEGMETVTMTLQQTNSFLVDPNASTALITIADSSTTISVYPNSGDAIKPGGPPGEPAQAGQFQFSRSDVRGLYPPLTAYYNVSGTASNGEDYTFLTGVVDFPDQVATVYLDVNPMADIDFDGIQSVTVTLVPTNSYLVDPDNRIATINIDDSSTSVEILRVQDAIETNIDLHVGQVGIFHVFRGDNRGFNPAMTVNYLISGTASNGVDYTTLGGSVTFAVGATDTNIYVQTLPDELIEGDETVTLTLIPNGNEYLISDSASNATVMIHDSLPFLTIASNLDGLTGIDYYAPSNSLIVSLGELSFGMPWDFMEIYTNIVITNGAPVTNVVVTNWSGINGIGEEVKIATAKASSGFLTNSAGFTNGDMFFGNNTLIGYISASSTTSNRNWGTLTNSTVTNNLPFRGGFCVDQTGTFSNNLIAVASDEDYSNSLKGVWSLDVHAHPKLMAQISTLHLEGVTTLTNDVQKWGPWAGKIITGDESTLKIFTVDTNSAVTTYDTRTFITNGIAPEDFDVIPANQALYVTAFNNKTVMELPARYFNDHVGDLLITQAGEFGDPILTIVHWDAPNSKFITTSVVVYQWLGGHIEHVTFAPIEFPGH